MVLSPPSDRPEKSVANEPPAWTVPLEMPLGSFLGVFEALLRPFLEPLVGGGAMPFGVPGVAENALASGSGED